MAKTKPTNKHGKVITQIWVTAEAAQALARASRVSGLDKQMWASRAIIRQAEAELSDND